MWCHAEYAEQYAKQYALYGKIAFKFPYAEIQHWESADYAKEYAKYAI